MRDKETLADTGFFDGAQTRTVKKARICPLKLLKEYFVAWCVVLHSWHAAPAVF